MIKFNKIYLNSTCQELIVSVEVPDEQWASSVYLDKIYITNTKPTDIDYDFIDETIYVGGEPGWQDTIEGNKKSLVVSYTYQFLELARIDLSKLVYVIIKVKGTWGMDTPCGSDREFFYAVAFDPIPIYNQGMGYLKELSKNCETPDNFIDFILREQGFEYALKTGNYDKAEEYYDNYLKNGMKTGRSINYKKGCGCG